MTWARRVATMAAVSPSGFVLSLDGRGTCRVSRRSRVAARLSSGLGGDGLPEAALVNSHGLLLAQTFKQGGLAHCAYRAAGVVGGSKKAAGKLRSEAQLHSDRAIRADSSQARTTTTGSAWLLVDHLVLQRSTSVTFGPEDC